MLGACGGHAHEAHDASSRLHDGGARIDRPDAVPMTESDVGAMDEYAVAKTVKGLRGDLANCIDLAGQRKSFLGGDIALVIHVGKGGRVLDVLPASSTIGDRATERCVMTVFAKAAWPAPVGGKVGEVRQEFGFPPRGRDAIAVDVRQLGDQANTARALLAQCGSGDLAVTVYLDPDGHPLGAGAATREPAMLPHLDCAAGALMELRFPSPGSWNGKVTLKR